MGFFDKFLGMIGIGQPDVTLQIDQNPLKFGGLATGRVQVTGGSRELPVSAINVELIKTEKKEDDIGHPSTVAEFSLPMGEAVLTSGGTMQADFAFQVPEDIQPTGGKISYKIKASADVPGWDPAQDFEVHVSPERDPMADENFDRYHVLPEEKDFRHSSVRGDFRIFALSGGFGEGWKEVFIARGNDGGELWRLDRFGRTAQISPDGSKLAVADNSKNVAIVDPETGEFLVEPFNVGGHISSFAWLENGDLAAAASDTLYVLDEEGNVKASYDSLDDGRDEPDRMFLSSLAPGPGAVVYAADANENAITAVDTTDGSARQVATQQYWSPDDLRPSRDGSRFLVDTHDYVTIYDADFGLLAKFDVPGKKGVRYIGQSEHSCTMWKPNAHLSPNNERILVNDKSGQLWLLDAEGEPLRRYARDVFDYVEDSYWIDDETFAAITNDGQVHIMEVGGFMPAFSARDV